MEVSSAFSLLPFGLRLRCPPACATVGMSCKDAHLTPRDAPPQGSTSMNSHNKQPPQAVGLYDPRFEHDACGVGMVARLDNEPTHEVVTRAITALENLEHRGATGADPCTGDGAGILMQMPDELLRAVVDFELPAAGRLRRADVLPAERGRRARERLEELLERTVARRGPAAARLARRAGRRGADGRGRGRLPAGDPPAVRRRRRGRSDGRPGRVRAQALRDPPDQRADRRGARACTSPRAPRARSTTRAC